MSNEFEIINAFKEWEDARTRKANADIDVREKTNELKVKKARIISYRGTTLGKNAELREARLLEECLPEEMALIAALNEQTMAACDAEILLTRLELLREAD